MSATPRFTSGITFCPVLEHISCSSACQWQTATATTPQRDCLDTTLRMLVAGLHPMLISHALPEAPRATESLRMDTWSSHAHAVGARRTAIRSVDEEYHGGQYCTLLHLLFGASRVVITLCDIIVG